MTWTSDAAVRRRIQGFTDDGLDVVGFTMRRRDDVSPVWENVDLGRRMSAHLLAERCQAGSGIDDDETRPAPDLDASRAAAELGE